MIRLVFRNVEHFTFTRVFPDIPTRQVSHCSDLEISFARFDKAFYELVFPLRVSAPNSPLHLSNRAHVLLLLNRPSAALTDADHAVRLRPDWGKVRRHRTNAYV